MTQNELGTKISPVIQDNKVISLRIDGKKIPLKRQIDVGEFFKNLLEPLNKLAEYVDLQALFSTEMKADQWSKEELDKFLNTFTENQRMILLKIFEIGKIPREKLVASIKTNGFDFDSYKLAGAVAGLNRRISQLNKEKLFSIITDDYIINDDYYEMFKLLLNFKNLKRKKGQIPGKQKSIDPYFQG